MVTHTMRPIRLLRSRVDLQERFASLQCIVLDYPEFLHTNERRDQGENIEASFVASGGTHLGSIAVILEAIGYTCSVRNTIVL